MQVMKNSKAGIKISLTLYDFVIFLIVDVILYVLYQGAGGLNPTGVIIQSGLALITIFGARFLGKIYRQIWRYGGIQCYLDDFRGLGLMYEANGGFAYSERAFLLLKYALRYEENIKMPETFPDRNIISTASVEEIDEYLKL